MPQQMGAKTVARNRPPRVHIEYELETYGSEQRIELPFVMGVLADLSGKPEEPLPAVGDRQFLEIDIDNFHDRLKSMRPRAAFDVPNTITGEGNLKVDVTFESLDDFSPDRVAEKVAPLRKLLEARRNLEELLSRMDGKEKAEAVIAGLLEDQELQKMLESQKQAGGEEPDPADGGEK